jgi:membrane protein DedA with SNARE-associated domain
MNDLLAAVGEWVVNIVDSFGYVGVFVLVTLGNLHLPVPTQLTLPLAGFLVGQGRFSFTWVMVWSSVAAVAVSLFFYYVGFWVGEESLRRFIERIERFKLVSESDLDKAGRVFDKHGGKSILIGHLVPGVGAFISIPAGLRHMPIFGRFMFYTVIGSILWNGVHVGAGWVLGSQWTLVKEYATIIEFVVLGAAVGAVIWFLLRRWRARKDSGG